MKLRSKGIFKNLFAMFLLLIVVTAIFVPLKEVSAAGLPKLPSIGDLISFDIFSIIIEFIADAAADEDSFLWPIYFLAYQFFNICLLCVTILVYFGAWLVDVFLDEDIYVRVLDMTDKTSAVYIGWTTVRDACNTFFILFLLLIAFSTILRIQAYNAKNLLPKLIISLFLINFSATIAMMVIDLGQVFMFEIKTWMGAGFSEGGKPLTSIIDYFNSEYNFASPTGKYNLGDVVGVAFAVAYSVILGLLYIMLSLFLMVRIVVFVILVIISPFAFFSIILPGMRTYTSQWWSSLVSHAIFGPIFLFFIFLSGKMAQSMQTFEPIAANDEISSLSYIIAELIPHVVALALLAAAIPVTQKLGAAGSSKIIGGAAGMGKVAVGTYAGIKLAGGLGKKAGGLTVGRAHSAAKGRFKSYNKVAEKVGGGIKSLPIVGRIKIQNEVAQAQKNKEKVAEKEKLMDNMTDPDKKKYVDSFKLDKNAQAEAQQAMFNLMAKDSGKGLTDARLMKMGYEKDTGIKRDILDKNGNVTGQEAVMKFDKERFEKDYGRAVAHGMDTTNIETYRPDLIKDKEDRMDKVRKTVADGNEKNIKLDVLLDEDIDDELQELLGKRRYKVLIDGKSQEEKDGLAKGKEDKIIRGMQIEKTQPGKKAKGSLDINSKEGKEKLFEQQTEIAYLTGTKHKAEKMRKIKGINNDQSLAYEDEEKVDPEIAKNVVNRMNTDDLVDQDPKFLKDTSHMIKDTSQFSRINRNKYVTTEQSEAIKRSIDGRMGEINAKTSRTDEEKDEYERLKTAADIMGSSITKADKKKKKEDKENKDKDKDDYDFGSDPNYGFASSKPQSKQSVPKNKSVSGQSVSGNQNTIQKLERLAKEEGFEEGINVSEKNRGISVGSAGFSRGSSSKSGKRKTNKVFVSPKIIKNTKELFETDEEFGKKGMTGLIKHEKMHAGKGPASKVLKREEAELEEYSKKEGVSPEDIKKKKNELHEKYHEGGESDAGGEMQTEVERINEAFKNPKQFVKDQARIHVTADAVHEGMDKMGNIEYGPENPGMHRTHSAFINKDTIKEITKEMEAMRQGLVAKHNAKKSGGKDERSSDSGDDDTTVEGTDDFMTGSGKGNLESETKKNKAKGKKTKSEKIRKAYLKTNIAIGEADKIALGAIGKVRKDVGLANKIVIPAIDKGIEVNKRKLADPNLTNKQIRKEEIKKFKDASKSIISKNADKGVDVIGDGAEEAFNKAAENATGKTKIALKTASAVAGNKHVRRAVSKKAKRLADQDEGQTVDEHPATKTDTKPKSSVSDKYPDSNDGAKENIKKPEEQSGNKRIKKFAGTMNEIGNMTMKGVAGRRGKDPVAETKMAMKVVDIASKLDKRAAIVKPVADVLLKEQLKIDKERQSGKKISQWEEDKRKFGALKKSVGKIIPKDSKNDGKYIEEVGKLLSELGKEKGGKAGVVMTGAGTVLQNKKAQEVISKEARNRTDSVETAKQPKPKQQAIKETKPETIVKTKSAPVVKTEITSKSNVGREMSEQIKKALEEVSRDMKQEITNNIAVNSSQEAVDIDFEKIIDVNKIAELVEKGIDMKDVEKNLKDVKKSFDKFKENNSGNADTTVFGAGISVAEQALDKAQTKEDHKKQAIELATIENVLGEIESGMKKQGKPNRKEKE